MKALRKQNAVWHADKLRDSPIEPFSSANSQSEAYRIHIQFVEPDWIIAEDILLGAESGAVDGECVSVNLASVIKARDSPPPDTCAVLRHAMQAIEGATSDAFIRVADPPRVGV